MELQTSLSALLYQRYKKSSYDSKNISPDFFSHFEIEEKADPSPNFIWNFYPSSHPYYTSLNPHFLHRIRSLKQLKEYSVILARDGLLPLLWFFERMASPPPAFPCTLLIHHKFASIVELIPEEWKPHLATYQLIRPKASLSLKSPDKVLFHTVVTKGVLTLKYLVSQLKHMLAEVNRQNCNVKEYVAFISFRDDPNYRSESDLLNVQCVKEILRVLAGKKVRFISHREFYHGLHFQEYRVFEINPLYFVADSYINYRVLSCGGELLENTDDGEIYDQDQDHAQRVLLSPFHQMIIRKTWGENKIGPEKREKLLKLKSEHPDLNNLLWSKDFFNYVVKVMEAIS